MLHTAVLPRRHGVEDCHQALTTVYPVVTSGMDRVSLHDAVRESVRNVERDRHCMPLTYVEVFRVEDCRNPPRSGMQ